MRKDVNVGLAIGGVLLAVLIVWGAVISGSKKSTRGVALDTTKGSTGDHATGEIPPPVSASNTDAHGADSAAPSNTGQSNAGTPNTVAPGTGASGTGAPGTGAQSPAPSPAAASVSPKPAGADEAPAPQTSDKKETDWGRLLNGSGDATVTTSTPPLLQAPSDATPPAGNSTDATAGTGDSAAAPSSDAGNIRSEPIILTNPAGSTADAHASAPAAAGKAYKVQSGDTFSSIAKRVYGDSRYYIQIIKANPKVEPTKLRPGLIINLPDASDVKAASDKPAVSTRTDSAPAAANPSSSARAPVDNNTEYRVAAGDSLYKISIRLYGSPEEVDHLYEINKSVIGSDQKKLKVGMVLKLPAPPTATASAAAR